MKIKVFKMNDCDWWAGETWEECLEHMREFSGYSKEEMEMMQTEGYPCELSPEDMDRYTFFDDDTNETRTFMEELYRLENSGAEFPSFFASTEF